MISFCKFWLKQILACGLVLEKRALQPYPCGLFVLKAAYQVIFHFRMCKKLHVSGGVNPCASALYNPVLPTHDLTQSFRAHTFSLHEDPWPNFSFHVAYAHRIFDDATQCKSCFCIASASACLELSWATASATFRYTGFSLRKRNSRTSPLCNFIMEVFDAAHVGLGPPNQHVQKSSLFQCAPLQSRSNIPHALEGRLHMGLRNDSRGTGLVDYIIAACPTPHICTTVR